MEKIFKNIKPLYGCFVLTFFAIGILADSLPKPGTTRLLIILLPLLDAWIFHWIRTYWKELPRKTLRIFLTLFLLSFVLYFAFIIGCAFTPLPYWSPGLRTYSYGLMLIFASLKIVLGFVFLAGMLNNELFSFAKKIRPIRYFQIGLCLMSAMIAVSLYGSIYEVSVLKVERINVRSEAVPKAFNAYKIAQFSDTHIGSRTSESHIKKLIDSINANNPNLVVFTGDMVNFHAEEFRRFHTLFRELRANDGVYAILGNHDYGGYVRWENASDSLENLHALQEMYQELGWRILRNEHIYIHRGEDSIVLAGVDHYTSKNVKPSKRTNFADTKKALEGVSTNDFVVMLSHNPQHFEEELICDFPYTNLMLSGHSHGGQMAIGVGEWKMSPARISMKHWRGFYHEGNSFLNVNTGCGFNALPFRIGMPPVVSVLTLFRD